jgi:hypothetical protein
MLSLLLDEDDKAFVKWLQAKPTIEQKMTNTIEC